jgi:FtsH-binding integral membrane protein
MSKITTFLVGLIRRIKMKEFRIGLLMTLIAVSFSLMVQGANVSNPMDKLAFSGGGVILFVSTIAFWNQAVKQIKKEELEEKESRDNSTTAINDLANKISDLVDEIRNDRSGGNEAGKA